MRVKKRAKRLAGISCAPADLSGGGFQGDEFGKTLVGSISFFNGAVEKLTGCRQGEIRFANFAAKVTLPDGRTWVFIPLRPLPVVVGADVFVQQQGVTVRAKNGV